MTNIKDNLGKHLTLAINESVLPVLIEYPDGRESPIQKAYFITGRTAAIKILVPEPKEVEDNSIVRKLNDTVDELQSDLDDVKNDLKEWEEAFPYDTPDDLKKLWDAIEGSIEEFADYAGVALVANDSENIQKLFADYKKIQNDLNSADETIVEMRLEISAANLS